MYKVLYGTNENDIVKESEELFLKEYDAIKFANELIKDVKVDEPYYRKRHSQEGYESKLSVYYGESEYSLTYENFKTGEFYDTWVFINVVEGNQERSREND